MRLITTWYGVFLVEDGEVRDARPFPEDASEIAARLEQLDAGHVVDEERDLAEDLGAFRVSEERQLRLSGATLEPLDAMSEAVERRAPDPDLLRQASLAEADRKVREGPPGRTLVQAVEAMDELQRIENLFDERLREWRPISEDAGDPADAEALARFEEGRSEVAGIRKELEAHVQTTVEEVAPNLAELATPAVAARLIALAGGLEDLARLPAGTIQTLGAEDALFNHLTEGSPPPKHGVIFQNPLVHRAPYKHRGKIARALANKLAIAARADAYTGAEIADDLRDDLEARLDEVKASG